MKEQKKKILIYGVSSYKNRGVEAIVNTTLKQINKNKYDITIASYDLPYNKNFYKDDVKYVDHYRINNLTEEEKELEEKYQMMPYDYNNFELLYQKDVINEMEKADICISAGGDNYCYDACTWLYALDKKSHDLGKKTILWGSSLFEEINDLELIENLNNFDVLVIRESLTLNAIKDYVEQDKILFIKDPAFSLPIKKVELNKWYKNNKNYIIINVSPLTIKNEEGYNSILSLISYIINNTEYSICLLPHVTTEDCNDLDILNKLKKRFMNENRVYLEENEYDCCELKYIISNSKIVVAARTHASIAAYSTCIPTLVIGYSVKAKGIAKDLFENYDNYIIDSNDLSEELLIEKFNYIKDNKQKIKELLSKQMNKIKEETSSIFEKVIKKIEEQEKQIICSKEKCIGCGLCSKQCPVNAIEMRENKFGFINPVIDIKKCINCNKCRINCPILKINNNNNNNYEKEIYAIKNKNLEERKKSTSGGVFSILAKKIILDKGVVYGCEMKNNKTKHIRITKTKELERIRGSKYIQSNIIDIFDDVKKDLDKKKKVLFSGTPCQVGAIKSFLNKEYKNLITVSVICHGVLNSKQLNEHLKRISKKNNKEISNWIFRNKEPNPWNLSSVSYYVGQKKQTIPFLEDELMYLYLNNINLRECCYNCKYKGDNNCADLIIGDYWGIEIEKKDFYDKLGVSALIVNSSKGKKFYDNLNICENADVSEGSIEDIYVYNPAYNKQIKCYVNRKRFLNNTQDSNYDYELEKLKREILEYELIKTKKELAKIEFINNDLNNKLNNIYNSKRWKIIDKPLNMVNKIIGKNKKVGR